MQSFVLDPSVGNDLLSDDCTRGLEVLAVTFKTDTSSVTPIPWNREVPKMYLLFIHMSRLFLAFIQRRD
jgi:hypothetical protein